MGYVITYNKGEKLNKQPENGSKFLLSEICEILEAYQIEKFQIMTLDGHTSPFVLFYNVALLNDIKLINKAATPLLWRGHYNARDYAFYSMYMRNNPIEFYKTNPGLCFISGNVFICRLSDYLIDKPLKNNMFSYC